MTPESDVVQKNHDLNFQGLATEIYKFNSFNTINYFYNLEEEIIE